MIQLYHGDCLDIIPKIKNQINLVLTDLPYGTTECSWDEVIPFELMWGNLKNLNLSKGTPIILFGAQPFTSRLILSNLKGFKHHLVWEKSKCGSPMLAKFRPMMKHEDVVVFTLNGEKPNYYPQMEVGEPYTRDRKHAPINNHGYGMKPMLLVNKGTRYPSSVLKFQQKWRRQDQVHPTQKPVELLEWLIKSYSKEGDTVLDFTMGSGSTGVACKNLGRGFVGIEKDEKYFNITKERLAT